jgi:ketosteroid isomerase-like protein
MSTVDITQYAAMRPYFEVITTALDDLADGSDFFDLHAEDVVVDYIVTVPGFPRQVVGRHSLAALYRDYGESVIQTGASDIHRYYDSDQSVLVLEYTIYGKMVSSGKPYVNRFVSVITIRDRKITHWRDYLDPLAVQAAYGDATPWISGQ